MKQLLKQLISAEDRFLCLLVALDGRAEVPLAEIAEEYSLRIGQVNRSAIRMFHHGLNGRNDFDVFIPTARFLELAGGAQEGKSEPDADAEPERDEDLFGEAEPAGLEPEGHGDPEEDGRGEGGEPEEDPPAEPVRKRAKRGPRPGRRKAAASSSDAG